MKPDDKPSKTEEIFEDPKLFIVIESDVFPKPGLETAFVDYSGISSDTQEKLSGCICDPVGGGVICTCNKVRVCNCVGYTRESTKSRSRSSGGSRSGCRCAPVH
ncbi:MAG: hypothetical protein LBH58_03865 [Tannerellaceae bacterium]|jgi:hypothetical protein|nr:hypothetical protein [Tannerellaceae bacterium]